MDRRHSTRQRRIWEIHPIAIREDRQGRGYGRILAEDIECLADAASGVLTLFVGVGDNTGRTSLAAADLYADPVSALRHKACEGPHPYRFWQSMGFRIVGVMPDGEGTDRHGIHLVKPVPGRQSPQ
jgi:aminoglycoside 6'-N-acetyltransferase I